MNHEQVDQFNLIDRYLMGKLAGEELVGFEEHFLDCPRCIARLQTTDHFLQDLRRVNTEQTFSPAATQRPEAGRRTVWPRLRGRPTAWAAIGVCVAALVGAFFAIRQAQHLQAEVNQARSEAAEAERRHEAERQAAALADQQRQETESTLAERIRQLEAQTPNRQAMRPGGTTAPGEGMQAGVNLPIFVLRSLRGGAPNAADPVNEIQIARSNSFLAFSLLLEDETKYAAYRIKILDSHNQPMLEKSGFQPDRNNALSIGFNAGFFRAGNHLLIVEGVKKDGGVTAVGKYPFRIIKNS
jgi:hypothetical protein